MIYNSSNPPKIMLNFPHSVKIYNKCRHPPFNDSSSAQMDINRIIYGFTGVIFSAAKDNKAGTVLA